MKILDVGCGNNKIVGNKGDIIIGIDISKFNTDADVIHDLNYFPYPLKKEEFDIIFCRHVLEHLNDIYGVIDEFYRLLKKGGKIIIIVPSWNSVNSFSDPTHTLFFTLDTFDHWDVNTVLGEKHKHYKNNKSFFMIKNKKLIFGKAFRLLGIQFLANVFYTIYKTYFCWIFPARDIYVELIKK